ncbi:MAG: FAD-dependent oxidoreductase [Planctomycetota bacterium]
MRILIAGNSAAGVSCAKTVRRLKPEAEVTIVSDEAVPYYSRCLLSYYLSGEITKNQMIIHDRKWYSDNRIELVTNDKVVEINPQKCKALLKNDKKINYDAFVLATGSSAVLIPIQGIDTAGVFSLRNLEHAEKIQHFLRNYHPRKAVILGAGFIGLKAAYALRVRGLEVTVVEKLPQIMPKMLDKKGSGIVSSFLAKHGIKIKIDTSIAEIISQNKRISSIKLSNNKKLPCDILIVAVGVKPNTESLHDSDIIDAKKGIYTNQYMKTSFKNIYACGDVAVTKDIVSEEYTINALWFNAVQQGRIAGYNIMGEERKYKGSLAANAVDFYGFPVIAVGSVDIKDNCEILARYNARERIYKKLVVKNERLVGALFIGNVEEAGVYTTLIRNRNIISGSYKENIIENPWNYPLKLYNAVLKSDS